MPFGEEVAGRVNLGGVDSWSGDMEDTIGA